MPHASPPPLRSVALADALHALAAGEAPAVVIDPGLLRPDALEQLVRAIRDAGATLFVAVEPTEGSVSRTLTLLESVPAIAMLAGDPAFDTAVHALTRRPTIPMPSCVLRQLAPRLIRLPIHLRVAAALPWCSRGAAPAFAATADYVPVPSRTTLRAFARAGLASPVRLRRIAQVASSWDLLDNPALSLHVIAVRTGFGSERSLTNWHQSLLGHPPRRARALLSEHDVVRRLNTAAVRSPTTQPDRMAGQPSA